MPCSQVFRSNVRTKLCRLVKGIRAGGGTAEPEKPCLVQTLLEQRCTCKHHVQSRPRQHVQSSLHHTIPTAKDSGVLRSPDALADADDRRRRARRARCEVFDIFKAVSLWVRRCLLHLHFRKSTVERSVTLDSHASSLQLRRAFKGREGWHDMPFKAPLSCLRLFPVTIRLGPAPMCCLSSA